MFRAFFCSGIWNMMFVAHHSQWVTIHVLCSWSLEVCKLYPIWLHLHIVFAYFSVLKYGKKSITNVFAGVGYIHHLMMIKSAFCFLHCHWNNVRLTSKSVDPESSLLWRRANGLWSPILYICVCRKTLMWLVNKSYVPVFFFLCSFIELMVMTPKIEL